MYILRLTSLIFALGMLVSKLFALPVFPVQQAGEGKDSRTYHVQSFNKIHLEGAYSVILEQGSQPGLRIETDEDNFQYIEVNSSAESLSLRVTKKHFNFDKMVLYITFQDLEKLEIEGGICLETKGYMDLKDFFFRVSGGANIEMNLKANRVRLIGEGGVKIEFNGVAEELDATISGAGYLNATELKTRRTNCRLEGACAASIFATDRLDASISGVGKINYKGNPQVHKRIEGIGLVSND